MEKWDNGTKAMEKWDNGTKAITTQNRVKIPSTFWLVLPKILVSIAKSEQSSGRRLPEGAATIVETMIHKTTGRYAIHKPNPERAKDSTKQM